MILITIVLLILSILIGFAFRKFQFNKSIQEANIAAAQIRRHGEIKDKDEVKKLISNEKKNTIQYRDGIEDEIKTDIEDNERKSRWLDQRIELLDKKEQGLAKKNELLNQKNLDLKSQKRELHDIRENSRQLILDRHEALQDSAEMNQDAANQEVLRETEEDVAQTYNKYVIDAETELEATSENSARVLIDQAIEHSGGKTVLYENHRSLEVTSKEVLGKIIGNAGQNVRAIEALTGVDIIIDDKENEVIINGYDPIRRATAYRVLERIGETHRVNPDVIEQIVNETNRYMDHHIRHYGEKAVTELGLTKVAPDLIKFIGRMHYRTSYGQNILEHSIETAKLAGIFAAELGEDSVMARRAGLLHDIGKSIDRDIEATHVEIGVELTEQYRESPVVVSTIASHHGDVESEYVIADLVTAADSISGSRQGARNESAADYLQRIKSLEGIANKQPEVDESYAIQAGRELRVIVQPKKTNDKSIHDIATEVKNEIEENVTYPGQVKVTVVRKLEIVEYAERRRA